MDSLCDLTISFDHSCNWCNELDGLLSRIGRQLLGVHLLSARLDRTPLVPGEAVKSIALIAHRLQVCQWRVLSTAWRGKIR